MPDAARENRQREAAPPRALFERPDLLAQEASIVRSSRMNWRGRLRDLNDYGHAGGSAADRRAIVEWMAAQEARRA